MLNWGTFYVILFIYYFEKRLLLIMKHKFIYIYAVCAVLLAGCGANDTVITNDVKPSASYEAVEESQRDMSSVCEEISQIANPYQSVTRDEFIKKLNIELPEYDFMEDDIYNILYSEYQMGIINFNFNNDNYEYRLSDIDLQEDVVDSTSFSGMYYDWTESGPIKGYPGKSCIMLNEDGQGVCQWVEGNFSYSIILKQNATKEKLIYMFCSLAYNRSMYLNCYEGYLDEALFWDSYKEYLDKDFNNDGQTDRVYREIIDNERCNYIIEFGNGDKLIVENASNDCCPNFEYMTFGSEKKEFVLYTNYYPGACGFPCYNDFAIFEKDNNVYKISKMPFSTSQYDGQYDQYVNVGFYSEKENEITYLCKEWKNFEETIVTDSEEYKNALMSYSLDEKNKTTLQYEEAMIYRYEKDPKKDDTLICTAHVIYHCSDEMSFAIKYDGTQWNIVDVFMSHN